MSHTSVVYRMTLGCPLEWPVCSLPHWWATVQEKTLWVWSFACHISYCVGCPSFLKDTSEVLIIHFASFSLWFAVGRGVCFARPPCPARCLACLWSGPTALGMKPHRWGWRGDAAWQEHKSLPWNKTLNLQEWWVTSVPLFASFYSNLQWVS